MNCDMVTGSVKLDYLPVPDRSLHGNMPFNPSQGMGHNESKLLRAAKALPFLGITTLAVYLMWGGKGSVYGVYMRRRLISNSCVTTNACPYWRDYGEGRS